MRDVNALPELRAVELRRLIGSRQVSPVELVEACIARIEALNPAINAIAATDFERARLGARRAEEAYLSNGRERIDLRVRFNNVELTLDSNHVVSAIEARPGRQVPLEIAAIKPADEYKPGDYYGTVHMVFDATAP